MLSCSNVAVATSLQVEKTKGAIKLTVMQAEITQKIFFEELSMKYEMESLERCGMMVSLAWKS